MIEIRFIISTLAVVLVAGSTGGCMIGRDYLTPSNDTPALFHEDTAAQDGKEKDEKIDLLWWRSFNDETLTNLIETGLRENKDLQLALARINEARALRRAAQLDLLPGSEIRAGYEKSKDNTARLTFSDNSKLELKHEVYSTELDASWELDLFGRVRREIESKRATEEAAVEDLHELWRTLAAEIARNYLELRGAQAELNVAEQNASNQGEALSMINSLVEVGQLPEIDQARARAQLFSTQALIPTLRGNVKVAIHQIAVLCGQTPESSEELLLAPRALPVYSGPVSLGDPAGLLRRRPDVRSAERRLAAATADVGVAQGDYFPRVTFSGRIALEADSPSGIGRAGSTAYSFGPSISWLILDFGHVAAHVKAADARSQAALAGYQGTVLKALQETENSLVRFSTESSRRELLKTAAEASNRALQLARDRYKEGATDFLTVLDAERVVLQAENDLTRSETQLSVNLLGIYKALGGGWENFVLTADSK